MMSLYRRYPFLRNRIRRFWNRLLGRPIPPPVVFLGIQHRALLHSEARQLFGDQVSEGGGPPVTGICHGFTELTAEEKAAGVPDCEDIHSARQRTNVRS